MAITLPNFKINRSIRIYTHTLATLREEEERLCCRIVKSGAVPLHLHKTYSNICDKIRSIEEKLAKDKLTLQAMYN